MSNYLYGFTVSESVLAPLLYAWLFDNSLLDTTMTVPWFPNGDFSYYGGVINQAIKSVSGDVMPLAEPQQLIPFNASFSVSVWFNSPDKDKYLIFLNGDTQVKIVSSGNAELTVADVIITSLSNDLCNGVWHHVVVTYDFSNNHVVAYVDGALVDTGVTTTVPSSTLNPQLFGNGGAPVGAYGVDLLYLYSSALTQSQVTTLYNSGAGHSPSV